MARQILFSVTMLVALGCVSVSLPKPAVSRAQVRLEAPPAPFEPILSDRSDQAWRNPINGNSISYFSSCHDPVDPTLESVRQEMLAGISALTIESSENTTFSSREALRTRVSGKVDGVAAKMDVIVFKKNLCLYGISYVGLAKTFADDDQSYERFLKGFVAP